MSQKKSQHLNADSKTDHHQDTKDIIDGDKLFSEEIIDTHDEFADGVVSLEDTHPNKDHLDKLKSLISKGHYTICKDKISKVADELLNDPEVSIGLK